MTSFKPYNLGCESSPSVPCETLLQDGWDTFLLFEPFSGTGEFIIVECEDCASSKFGYPNDEGLPEHPHYLDGLSDSDASVLVSEETLWLSEVSSQMRRSSERIWGGRGMKVSTDRKKLFHFIIPLKEATFECIASSLKIAHRAKNYDEAFIYVRERFAQH
ncbi:MAG: hypothetical protein PVI97_13560 [Candidatus Thiodiazotropha sp.]|jgi:hypothetical protein